MLILKRCQFNAIDPSTGWKADPIIRKARFFSKSQFGRRQHRELFGIDVAFATLEDLIIAKLEWSELEGRRADDRR